MNTLICYNSYSYELAKEANVGKKREVVDKYVLEEDYKTECDEPFLISYADGHDANVNQIGYEVDHMLSDVLWGECCTMENGEDLSCYLERVYFPLCDGFDVEQDDTIYCVYTIDDEGEITGRNYFFEGFRPVCELYDTPEDALAAHNYKKENHEMDIDNSWI